MSPDKQEEDENKVEAPTVTLTDSTKSERPTTSGDQIPVYTDEETEYSKAFGPKAPYIRPKKPSWANRNYSGFDIKMDIRDSTRRPLVKPVQRNVSQIDITVEPNAKVECITQYMRDFTIGSVVTLKTSSSVTTQSRSRPRKNIGRIRRPGTFPDRDRDRSLSLERFKKTFDDDENANPTLKYFINLIARK